MPSEIDPSTLTLALILTGAGTTVAATVIASLIEIFKRFPGVGPALDAGLEGAVSVILAAILVAYAYIATHPIADAMSGFAAFLAFVGIAKLSGGAYDTGRSIKASLTGG